MDRPREQSLPLCGLSRAVGTASHPRGQLTDSGLRDARHLIMIGQRSTPACGSSLRPKPDTGATPTRRSTIGPSCWQVLGCMSVGPCQPTLLRTVRLYSPARQQAAGEEGPPGDNELTTRQSVSFIPQRVTCPLLPSTKRHSPGNLPVSVFAVALSWKFKIPQACN